MLEAAGVPYEAVSPDFDEDAAKAELSLQVLGAAALADALAERKALAVSAEAGQLVLGSDQTLELHDGKMLSKPRSPDDLVEQLHLLSGTTHRLHSAAVVADQGRPVWRAVETVAMTVRPLSEDFIRGYVEREYETVRWSVGGYHVEGGGVHLFDSIEGSHFAVLGMSLLPLLGFLRQRGILSS
jgi:septum formation protein